LGAKLASEVVQVVGPKLSKEKWQEIHKSLWTQAKNIAL
jgi:hypothetical protein